MLAWFFGSGTKPEESTSSKDAPPTAPVAQANGDLFKYYFSETGDPPSKFYLKEMDVVVKVEPLAPAPDTSTYQYVLQVYNKMGESVLVQVVHPHMQLETYEAANSFIWTSIVLDGPQEGVHKWSVIFTRTGQRDTFLFELKRCMFEVATQMPFQKVKDEDRDFCLQANELMTHAEEDEAYDPEVDFLAFDGLHISETPQERRRRLADDADAGKAESEEDEESTPGAAPQVAGARGGDKERNSLLVDSARHKRTFVVRGNAIGVFNRDKDCEFDTELKGIADLKGQQFTPSRVMLHNSDSRLLMLNCQDPTKLFPLDLETGKVVEEWNVDKDALVKVRNFTPSTKHGGMLGEQTFVAMASNVVVGVDPRLSDAAKAIGNPHEYTQTSNPGFTCCATTAKGHLAVGTTKGEIKFFVGVPGMPHPTSSKAAACPKSAKTLLPGLGDEIIGLDLTADGAWVLATCKTYLLVISTLAPDQKSTGFETRLGKDKPRPRRLCLTPEDQQLVGLQHPFTPASFNAGKGEMFIVTSIGAYIVTWNFRAVQHGNSRAYVIKRTSSQIMSEQFFAVLPDQEGYHMPIVLAHKDDVRVERRKAYDRNPCLAPQQFEFDRSPSAQL